MDSRMESGAAQIMPLASCPKCRRIMVIKEVRRKLRGNNEQVQFACLDCGESRTENVA